MTPAPLEGGADGATQGGGSLLSLLPGGGNLVGINIIQLVSDRGDIQKKIFPECV